ncbi:MarR family winged helix-turn-helix transcriptional regulator [Streptomyces sp. M41(2017)]|uniref:MarR family winged helix-turn-helix transcriptional regulator n=1 Tax=unclassified Streptomyces TaxID=2593676 RepID=UPI0009BD86F8|nr:MarR family winged helix-turn-helix transcriptional regulator [Streptomyces sp. M41(2017)]OQQ14019.1 MarR family transcriptional regulator [Streptomyces sp. M41(2017)]
MSATKGGSKGTRRSTADEDITLDTDLGWAIRMVSSAFRRVAGESVAGLPGGPRGYLVLVALAAGEPPTQLALAQQVSLDRTVMTYLLDDLEAGELIERRPDPRDRRARQVVITDKGRDELARARRGLATAEGRLLADLDESDTAALRTLLTRVAHTAQSAALGPDESC